MSSFYEGKLVGVTGATGLIGSYVTRALAEKGAEVRAIRHNRPPNEFTFQAQEIVEADLLDFDSASRAVRGVEIVIHAAGVTGGVPLATADPSALVGPNAVIHSQVIHACAKERVSLLGFISSTVVYSPTDRPVREDDAWRGDPYGQYFGPAWVARFGEKLCEFYHSKYGFGIAIIRPSGTYGRYDNFDEGASHVLPALIKRALAGDDHLQVWGDGRDVKDFIHASDVANGLLLAVERHANCDPLNIASGIACSTEALAQTILDAVGSRARLEFDLSKPTALRERMVDIRRAKEILGFEPRVSLKDGIKDTVEWYREATRL